MVSINKKTATTVTNKTPKVEKPPNTTRFPPQNLAMDWVITSSRVGEAVRRPLTPSTCPSLTTKLKSGNKNFIKLSPSPKNTAPGNLESYMKLSSRPRKPSWLKSLMELPQLNFKSTHSARKLRPWKIDSGKSVKSMKIKIMCLRGSFSKWLMRNWDL